MSNEGSWCFGHCYCRRNTPIFALTETLPADPFPMRLRHHQHGHIFPGKFWVQYLLNEPFRLKEHKNNYVQYPRYPKLPEMFFWLFRGAFSAKAIPTQTLHSPETERSFGWISQTTTVFWGRAPFNQSQLVSNPRCWAGMLPCITSGLVVFYEVGL